MKGFNYTFPIPQRGGKSEEEHAAELSVYVASTTMRSRAAMASPSLSARAKAGIPAPARPAVWRAFIGTNTRIPYWDTVVSLNVHARGQCPDPGLAKIEDQVSFTPIHTPIHTHHPHPHPRTNIHGQHRS